MTLTFEDAARVLRASTVEQTTGSLIEGNGSRCAVGVLGGEELGLESLHKPIFQGQGYECDFRIGKCYGMTSRMVTQIIYWNDSAILTFEEIADKIDMWSRGDFFNITEADPKAPAKPLIVVL